MAGNATLKATAALHRKNKMYVVGGLIIGNPGDTPESIEANLEFARQSRRLAIYSAPHALSPNTDDRRFAKRG